MAIFKCKMCGGDLNIINDVTVAECEYCGSKQTVPVLDNEKKLSLYSHANRLRLACEFDRAAGVYDSIVAEFPTEAEARWGLILCKYGIEYVDDPTTGNKIPTCHRSSFDSVMDDPNFDQVMEYGDAVARRVYREEAKTIEELRKSIIEISGKEEPYDIFISYKDTDDAGQRTVDSVIAQDVYEALTAKGYRVFFSRISLEDKLGTEYEPYIFAALNSAKIMLVFGTDYEYFNAVWVKNEWSRYLQLMTKDKSKHLIPCFKGIDAYDMPKEFQKLSAQDMGKVGAMQDLLRGVGKILPKEEKKPEAAAPVVQQVVQGGGPNVAALVKRGNMALEDGEWETARSFFDQALNMDAECGEAYLGKELADWRCVDLLALETKIHSMTITENSRRFGRNFERAVQFAVGSLKKRLDALRQDYNERLERCISDKHREEENARLYRQKEKEENRLEEERAAEEARQRFEQMVSETAPKAKKYRARISPVQNLLTGGYEVLTVMPDGTVKKTNPTNIRFSPDEALKGVSNWREVVSVKGVWRNVYLKADGTAVAAYLNLKDRKVNETPMTGWSDIQFIDADYDMYYGLTAAGTVVKTKSGMISPAEIDGWNDIIAIEAGDLYSGSCVIGLRKNGTVVADGDKAAEVNEVISQWENIVSVSFNDNGVVGVKDNGTVVAANFLKEPPKYEIVAEEDEMRNQIYLQRLSELYGVVSVYAVDYCNTFALLYDGTVRYISGHDEYHFEHLETLQNIVAIYANGANLICLQADGTLTNRSRAGINYDFSGLKLFEDIEHYEDERKQKVPKRAEIDKLQTERKKLGLFDGKKKKEIDARIAALEAEIRKL